MTEQTISIERMEEQARRFRPRLAVLTDEAAARDLTVRLADTGTKVLGGPQGLEEAAALPEADTIVTAVVGMVGLRPTLTAIREKKRIALANKETLVCAGELVMDAADTYGAEIIPVDSEHSAIFQCLQGCRDRREIRRLILTCSGGPFYGKKRAELQGMTRKDALQHPNWSMGRKITIDDSTMVNKGLEVIEAKWLFDVDVDRVQVVVQPQSIIHSMVEYVDGAIIAELGTPDMKLPIQYALYYPERRFLPGDRVDFWTLGKLEFEKPDTDTFYGLELAYEAGRKGGSLPTVFNAANELAVSKFLNREIKYLEITEIIEDCMKAHKNIENPTLEQILETEAATYERINSRR